jgi:uncharacterized protein (DUF983 family)
VGEASPLVGAIAGCCPRCQSKALFAGWIKFADTCRACGLDFSSFNVGDGPAAFLILIIGAILVAAALVVDGLFTPPLWVHLIWIPIGIGLTVLGLRWAKALLLTQEYRHRAREGRIIK